MQPPLSSVRLGFMNVNIRRPRDSNTEIRTVVGFLRPAGRDHPQVEAATEERATRHPHPRYCGVDILV